MGTHQRITLYTSKEKAVFFSRLNNQVLSPPALCLSFHPITAREFLFIVSCWLVTVFEGEGKMRTTLQSNQGAQRHWHFVWSISVLSTLHSHQLSSVARTQLRAHFTFFSSVSAPVTLYSKHSFRQTLKKKKDSESFETFTHSINIH